ncbi:hypothetical protein [Dyadobacter sp. OTU695]|uniref:hypothetical protein n=1 Tax=Dyadobacter sp. OTU695 TaxID=3043860 RepID=UPI00313CF620
MTRTSKKWAGIALSITIIMLFLCQRSGDDARMRTVWQLKYDRTRKQISWQLMHLRHGYGTQQMHISKNTALEIRRFWDDRDVLFHVLQHRESPFPADSLIKLEQLIDRRAPLTTLLREIERIEKINETD